MIKYNPQKHSVFDFLSFEYNPNDKDFFIEEENYSEENINLLEQGWRMERDGWGFLEHENCILFRGKQDNLKKRTYFKVIF